MSKSDAQPKPAFTTYQKFVIAVLAFLQFTIILDFMIISPLGALLMPALKISPAEFGKVVSVYAFSAGISGILAAGFADRFDRKKILLFFYCGFILGTLLCGLAQTYEFLLFSRLITGLFGGVIGSITMAIATDLFAFEVRGRVMGFLQTSFAASQILGIPAGLFFSNLWGWHAPFLLIVLIGLSVGTLIFTKLKPVNAHLKKTTDRNPIHHLIATATDRKYVLAFLTTTFLSIGGYMLMPFGSAFSVHNLGVSMDKLPFLYLITGLCAIFIGPLVGKACDTFGKYRVFVFGACLSIVTVVYYTHMGLSPFWLVVTVNTVMFVAIFSRMIPSQALMSALPTPQNRGAFMSISSSIQQISGGVASVIAGLIVSESAEGTIQNFDVLGFILVGTAVTSVCLMYFVHKGVPENGQTQTSAPGSH